MESVLLRTGTGWLVAGLAVCLVLSEAIGRRVGRWHRTPEGQPARSVAAIEAAMFALLGLLLAFDFAMAGSRLEIRREKIISEANSISTAYLRTELFHEPLQSELKRHLRRYLEARLDFFFAETDLVRAMAATARGERLEGELWSVLTAAPYETSGPPVAWLQTVPAFNTMFDSAASRLAELRIRMPTAIVGMVFLLALGSAFIYGYSSGLQSRRVSLGSLLFALVASTVIGVTLDLDRPRRGLIRLDDAHQSMVDLRALMDSRPPKDSRSGH